MVERAYHGTKIASSITLQRGNLSDHIEGVIGGNVQADVVKGGSANDAREAVTAVALLPLSVARGLRMRAGQGCAGEGLDRLLVMAGCEEFAFGHQSERIDYGIGYAQPPDTVA
jgi:hypothetical protein